MTEISHKKVKGQSQKWIKGYQVIVAEIQGAHNARLEHPLAAFPLPYRPSR